MKLIFAFFSFFSIIEKENFAHTLKWHWQTKTRFHFMSLQSKEIIFYLHNNEKKRKNIITIHNVRYWKKRKIVISESVLHYSIDSDEEKTNKSIRFFLEFWSVELIIFIEKIYLSRVSKVKLIGIKAKESKRKSYKWIIFLLYDTEWEKFACTHTVNSHW